MMFAKIAEIISVKTKNEPIWLTHQHLSTNNVMLGEIATYLYMLSSLSLDKDGITCHKIRVKETKVG